MTDFDGTEINESEIDDAEFDEFRGPEFETDPEEPTKSKLPIIVGVALGLIIALLIIKSCGNKDNNTETQTDKEKQAQKEVKPKSKSDSDSDKNGFNKNGFNKNNSNKNNSNKNRDRPNIELEDKYKYNYQQEKPTKYIAQKTPVEKATKVLQAGVPKYYRGRDRQLAYYIAKKIHFEVRTSADGGSFGGIGYIYLAQIPPLGSVSVSYSHKKGSFDRSSVEVWKKNLR